MLRGCMKVVGPSSARELCHAGHWLFYVAPHLSSACSLFSKSQTWPWSCEENSEQRGSPELFELVPCVSFQKSVQGRKLADLCSEQGQQLKHKTGVTPWSQMQDAQRAENWFHCFRPVSVGNSTMTDKTGLSDSRPNKQVGALCLSWKCCQQQVNVHHFETNCSIYFLFLFFQNNCSCLSWCFCSRSCTSLVKLWGTQTNETFEKRPSDDTKLSSKERPSHVRSRQGQNIRFTIYWKKICFLPIWFERPLTTLISDFFTQNCVTGTNTLNPVAWRWSNLPVSRGRDCFPATMLTQHFPPSMRSHPQ